MKTELSIPILLSASTINGTSVEKPEGEGRQDRSAYGRSLNDRNANAVLSFGGILGAGDKFSAIPWDALYVDTKQEKIVFVIFLVLFILSLFFWRQSVI